MIVQSRDVDNSQVIRMLAHSYRTSKRKLDEEIQGFYRYPKLDISDCLYRVKHMERCAEVLAPEDRLIILKEVIEGKVGRWYEEFMTSSGYYRRRNNAYRVYLKELKK